MPRGVRKASPGLPATLKFTTLSGAAFAQAREHSKLVKVHPDIVEMGQRLLLPGKVSVEAGVFTLGTPEHKAKGDDLLAVFVAGLTVVAQVCAPERRIKVKAVRDGDRLVFWYAPKGEGGRKAVK